MKGFLDHWLICGPFFSDRGWTTLDEDYLFGEASVAARRGLRTFGREWIEFDTSDHFLQFLDAPFEHTLFVTAYAHTYVRAPKDMGALLLTGSDDGIKVWLNGEVVLRNDVNRSAVPGDDVTPVHLNAGWNSLLVKVRQGMNHWQFCAQLLDRDGGEIAGLESAREAEYPRPESVAQRVGVRVRFNVETYELLDGCFRRDVQFEVGSTGSRKCSDVTLRIEGAPEVPAGDLEPGETRLVSARLPFESMVQAMQGRLRAASDGSAVETAVIASEPSRLLRDLCAPFFIPRSEGAEQQCPLAGFEWETIAEDGEGVYKLVDPPGPRRYLASLVNRFPMPDAEAAEARELCQRMLDCAISGDAAAFEGALAEATGGRI